MYLQKNINIFRITCISNQHKFLNWTFSLSFPKLLTIHVIPRSRELIIHAISRVRQRVRSKQHIGLCVNQGVGQRQLVDYRRTVGRLSISYHWRFIWVNKFFLCVFGKLTYHKCSFTFPLLLIQIRAERLAFFALSCHKPHSVPALYIVRR